MVNKYSMCNSVEELKHNIYTSIHYIYTVSMYIYVLYMCKFPPMVGWHGSGQILVCEWVNERHFEV